MATVSVNFKRLGGSRRCKKAHRSRDLRACQKVGWRLAVRLGETFLCVTWHKHLATTGRLGKRWLAKCRLAGCKVTTRGKVATWCRITAGCEITTGCGTTGVTVTGKTVIEATLALVAETFTWSGRALLASGKTATAIILVATSADYTGTTSISLSKTAAWRIEPTTRGVKTATATTTAKFAITGLEITAAAVVTTTKTTWA
jgi:hypothetical protein